jgi:hypothetical protein
MWRRIRETLKRTMYGCCLEDLGQGPHRLTQHTWHYDPLFTAVREYANYWYDERRMTTCEGQQGYLYALCLIRSSQRHARGGWIVSSCVSFLAVCGGGLLPPYLFAFGDPMSLNPQFSRMRDRKQLFCFETCLELKRIDLRVLGSISSVQVPCREGGDISITS